MEGLRERFRARAADDLKTMSSAFTVAEHEILRERAHRLAGVAATFGYPEVGEAAGSLDETIRENATAEEIGCAARRLFDLLSRAIAAE